MGWWEDLAKLTVVNAWLLGITAVLTLILAFFGVASWKVGDRVSEVRDRADDKYKQSTARDIADANAEAAKANADAKRAIEATAHAEGETEKLRRSNLELQERVEKERTERLALEQRVAPRRLTRDQIAELAKRLLPLSGRTINIEFLSAPEPIDFADDIERAMRVAGVSVQARNVMLGMGQFRGVRLRAGANRQDDASVLANVLVNSSITPKPVGLLDSNDANELAVVVGVKPD
jgi:hypothetical protein